jgi:hypothetical protein
MERTIRPIGPVTETLRKAGYRQYAAIFVDGKQVPNVAVLTTKEGDTVKFTGHWIDPNGEVHQTRPLADMKKAANRIMTIIETTPVAQPAAKKPAARRRHTSKPTPQSAGAMIECRGCGKRHPDDTLCPED